MSGPQAHMEFVDVLSSIRRLVSEHKRTEDVSEVEDDPDPVEEKVQANAEAPRRLPQESRFVLTAAHRVSPEEFEGEASEETGFDPAEPSRAVEAAEAEIPDVEESAPDPVAVADMPGEPADAVPVQSADIARPAAEIASLEETIAELEAAVAGIDEEFEPDLGDPPALDEELEQDAAWAAVRGAPQPDLTEPAPRAFQGIMAGFDGLSAPEERLDLPIIGDVNMPIIPRGDNWRISLPQRRAEPAPTAPVAPAGEAVSQDDDPLAAQAATDADSLADTAPVTTDPLVLGVSQAVLAPADQDAPTDEAPQDASVEAAMAEPADESLLGAADDEETAPTDADETSFADEPIDGGQRLHLAAGEAVRPAIIRAETVVEGLVEDLTGPVSEAVAGLDGMFGAARDDGADEDDGDDLFDPLAALPVDPDQLRELVADVIRDQLRGALGERITRNVRVLVRREIERVLAEYGLKRD